MPGSERRHLAIRRGQRSPLCRLFYAKGNSRGFLGLQFGDLAIYADSEDSAAVKRTPALVNVHAAHNVKLLLGVNDCVARALHFTEVQRVKRHLTFGAISFQEVNRNEATARLSDLGTDDLVVCHGLFPGMNES